MEQAREKEIRTVGTRIHYTGDMANSESFGVVTKVLENDKYNYNQIEITFDDERFEGDTKKATVCLSGFSNGPGCRFSLEREWKANQQATLARYMSSNSN